MKVEWRSASAMFGVLCVIMAGTLLMQQLCVVSLDTPGEGETDSATLLISIQTLECTP